MFRLQVHPAARFQSLATIILPVRGVNMRQNGNFFFSTAYTSKSSRQGLERSTWRQFSLCYNLMFPSQWVYVIFYYSSTCIHYTWLTNLQGALHFQVSHFFIRSHILASHHATLFCCTVKSMIYFLRWHRAQRWSVRQQQGSFSVGAVTDTKRVIQIFLQFLIRSSYGWYMPTLIGLFRFSCILSVILYIVN